MNDDIKYLLNGKMVKVVSRDGDGFIVRVRYKDGGEFEPTSEEEIEEEGRWYGKPFYVKEVFATAPVAQYDEQVLGLREAISELYAEKNRLDVEIEDTQKRHHEMVEKFGKIAELKNLRDFIDGKITHLVIERWSDTKVVKFDDFIKYQESGGFNRISELKLMSLFGSSDGDLKWRIHEYSDGSGSSMKVYPCLSRDEAIIMSEKIRKTNLIKEIQSAIGNDRFHYKLYKEAVELGISDIIPNEQAIKAIERELEALGKASAKREEKFEALSSEANQHADCLEKLSQLLAKLSSKPTTGGPNPVEAEGDQDA